MNDRDNDTVDALEAMERMHAPPTDEELKEMRAAGGVENVDFKNITISVSHIAATMLPRLLQLGFASFRRSQADMRMLAENADKYDRALAGDADAFDDLPVLLASTNVFDASIMKDNGIDRDAVDLSDPAVKGAILESRNICLAVQMLAFAELGILAEKVRLESIRHEAESSAYSAARVPMSMKDNAYESFLTLFEKDCAGRQELYGEDWHPGWAVRDYAKWVLDQTEDMNDDEMREFNARFADHFLTEGGI